MKLKEKIKQNRVLYIFFKNCYKFVLKIQSWVDIKKDKLKNMEYRRINKKIALNYQKYKKKRRAKGIIYTCIIGDYDNLKSHKYINFEWDYICFTNNKNLVSDGIWEIKSLAFNELDNVRNNRWHKLNPHLLFQKYEKSLYIDGNVRILSSDFFELLLDSESFISAIHPGRNCLYVEAEICKQTKLEKKEIIDNQINIIKKAKFPKNYGLYEANILYRKHNEEKIIKMDEEWWEFVSKQAKRDQLSLTYVCWRNNIPFRTFLDTSFRIKNKYIEITPHLIRRK